MTAHVRWTVALLLGPIILFAAFAVAFWRIGLFEFTGSEAAAKVVTAALGLLGAAFASLATFAGLAIRKSLDDRNLILKQSGEERLRIDSAIRAVDLLPDDPRSAASRTLFGLCRLGQTDYALHLLEEMWARRQIRSASAVWVIEQGLSSGDEDTQAKAAAILNDNAEGLLKPPDDLWLPASIVRGWNRDLPPTAKYFLIDALVTALLERPLGDWSERVLAGLTRIFVEARRDPDEFVRSAATIHLAELLSVVHRQTIFDGSRTTNFEKERPAVAGNLEIMRARASKSDRQLAERLRDWSQG